MRRFLAIFLLSALSVHAEAQDSPDREHFFPLIADGDGFRSRLFITGVSDATNRCSLSLRGPGLDAGIFQADGAVTATGTGAEIDLGSTGGSVTLTSAGGPSLAFGYATLDCAEPTVARMLLSLENGGTPLSLATLESASPGMSFQFPVLPRLGRLAMVFSSDAGLDAVCAVELEDEAGASLGGGSVSVPTRSTALQFLDELIPFPDGFVAGKARVSCNRDIAALGIPLSGPVFTALSATMLEDDSASASHILPLIQDGGGFRFRVLLTNLAESANRCTVDVRGGGLDAGRFDMPAGASASDSGIVLELAARGDQASLPSTGEQALAYGYAAVECDGPVDARNLLTVDAAGELAGMAAVSGARPADGMEFPVLPGLGQLTLAMNNEGESEASCAIELTVGGDTVSSTGLFQVPGRSTLLRFLGDLFALPDDFSGGMARLSCYSEVSAASLLVSDPVFAAMPATVVPIRTNPESARTIPDDNLRLLIFRQLGKAPGALVGPEELSELRSLNARNAGIESLEGLQHATGLIRLDLGPAPWDPENGHVNSNRITDLSPIFGLSKLEYLNLSHNGLSGPIPPELGQLSNLQTLDLSNNELSGSIPPELGNLANLTYLGLLNNQLRGQVPESLEQICDETRTRCEFDRIIGAIEIAIPDANLRGVVAEILGREPDDPIYDFELTGLRRLEAQNAGIESLEGLQYATGLTSLNLGPAPWDPENGYVNGNRVTDLSPILGLSNLEYLNLAVNELSGPIPAELGNLTALTNLDLGGNELSGPIPSQLGGLTELTWLWLWGNQLSGTIPAELGNLTALTDLNLNGNELSGSIPVELGRLSNLKILQLGGNMLSGTVPPELGNLTALTFLYLSDNELSGPIPSQLGGLTELTSLWLWGNQLSGTIPAEFGQLGNLIYMDLSNNELNGPIPSELGQLGNLRSLQLVGNQLTGNIPAALGQLSNLEFLNLGSNMLSGTVPPELENLAGLTELTLDSNDLSGEIPSGLLDICMEGNAVCAFDPGLIDSSVDSDGDGATDFDDAFPYDAAKTADSDGDGVDDENDPSSRDSAIGDLRIFKGNLITMPVSENLLEIERSDFKTYTQRLYEHFTDSLDFVMLFTNLDYYELPGTSYAENWGYSGAYYGVSNDVSGIGTGEYFDASWGSAGELESFLHFPYWRGPMFHEVAHRWANYVIPTADYGHWGFSSANGVLGGFDPANLQDLGNDRHNAGNFSTFTDYSGGSKPRIFSELELYLAGFVAASEVPDILYFEDGEWGAGRNFTGTQQTMTMGDLIAQHGERVPSWAESQKDFRAAAVLIYNEASPPNYDRLKTLHNDIVEFSGTEPEPGHESNFHRATRGLGTIRMDDLGALVRQSELSSRVAESLPPSYGSPPDLAHDHVH